MPCKHIKNRTAKKEVEKPTKDEMLILVKEKGVELGRTPKVKECLPWSRLVVQKGYWNDFVKEAGFKPNKPGADAEE